MVVVLESSSALTTQPKLLKKLELSINKSPLL